MSTVLVALLCWQTTAAPKPRPPKDDIASVARWLLHESDYGVITTVCSDESRPGCAFPGGPFAGIGSVADGLGKNHSTGVARFLIPTIDATAQDLVHDSRCSIAFSESSLGTCATTAEDPPCSRLTLSGRLRRLNTTDPEYNTSLGYLFATHPVMKAWMDSSGHLFAPYVLDLKSIFFIDWYGGAKNISTAEFLAAAPWDGDQPPVHSARYPIVHDEVSLVSQVLI
jgi:hypothetical protein